MSQALAALGGFYGGALLGLFIVTRRCVNRWMVRRIDKWIEDAFRDRRPE